MPKSNSKILIIAAFFAIYVIWGSTYLLNKIAVTEIAPLYLASIRFFCAGLLVFFLAIILKHKLSITKKQLINSVFVGFMFLVYGNGVYVWALQYTDSGFAALIASTQPLFVIILMWVLFGKKIKLKSILGIALGLIGMYLLISQDKLETNENTIIGVLMMLSCVLVWSYGSIYVAKADLPKSFLVTTGYQMLTASVFLLLFSFCFNETWSSPNIWSYNARWSLVLLIIFGGIVAFTAYNYLLKVVSTEKVATSAYVNPVIAVFLGWYILEEQLTMQSIIATIVLLTGVYFITSTKKES